MRGESRGCERDERTIILVKRIARCGLDTLNNENLFNFNLLVSHSYFPSGN